ncbi:hypothetical protein JXA84_07755 [candidate division WOR-3 bacterium]|nr:hypothetical protein [candidate division WOR-3 bacterium]
MEELAFEESGMSVKFKVEEGPYVTIKDVVFTGNHSTSQHFLLLESRLPRSDFLFDSRRISRATNNIDELGFLTVSENPYLVNTGRIEYASLVIPVKSRRTNTVSGSFFVLPQTNATGGKIYATIKNIAGSGHSLSVNWEKPDEKKTLLALSSKVLWLFSRPLDAEAGLSIRRDEQSDRLTAEIKLYYNLQYASIYSGLEYLDFSSTNGRWETYRNVSGVVCDFIDYKKNPSRGFLGKLEVKNGSLTSNSVNYYDFSFTLSAETFLPLKPFTLRLASTTQAILTDADLEDLKILYGGENGPRGFLNESISARKGSIFVVEPRVLTGKTSHVMLFYEFFLYEDTQKEVEREHSFGAGFSLGTNEAVLKIYIAGNPKIESYRDAVFYADVSYDF